MYTNFDMQIFSIPLILNMYSNKPHINLFSSNVIVFKFFWKKYLIFLTMKNESKLHMYKLKLII